MSKLSRIEKVMKKRPHVPSSADPSAELRKLVNQHRAITRSAVAIEHMASHRTSRETGERIECRLPEDVRVYMLDSVKQLRKDASKLESAMLRQLRQIPIYAIWLKHVWGMGPVIAAYLVVEINIHIAVKPSNLRRFCGMGLVNGKMERRTRGQKNAYNAELRTRLYQFATAMWKNSHKHSAAAPNGVTTKYLEATWNYRARTEARETVRKGTTKGERATLENGTENRERASQIDGTKFDERAKVADGTTSLERANCGYVTSLQERAVTRDEANVQEREIRRDVTKPEERAQEVEGRCTEERALVKDESANHERASDTDGTTCAERSGRRPFWGWQRAADLFVCDLYVVWRALEGLPVWLTYNEAILRGGVPHGQGEPVTYDWEMLTVEQAIARVGNVGAIPLEAAEAAE